MSGGQRFLDATTQTVAWFWKRSQDGELELQPPFQRNPVWQDAQKSYLIDTILRGYPVPEVYLQNVVESDGTERHIVVDGQQRTRACIEFIAGKFALVDDATSLYPGYKFDSLPDEVRSQIYKYKFIVRSLPPMPETELRDIFGRLNRNNVALNAQELRHATYWGEFISSMTTLSQHQFWLDSGLFTANDFRRMLDIEYVSDLAAAVMFGPQNKRYILDRCYADFEAEFPDRERVETNFDRILGELVHLMPWPNHLRWSRKVDFYSLFLAMVPLAHNLPFDRETRLATREALSTFSESVTLVLTSTPDQLTSGDFPSEAILYSRGVRNSSDSGSRRLRILALSRYLWSGDADDEDFTEALQQVQENDATEDESALE